LLPDPHVKFLRSHETLAEKRLWQQLCRKRIGNRRFRRQYRLGRYIVDFVCLSARLIIEIDGPSHEFTAGRDELRTRWLTDQGFRVIRFSNEDVLFNLDSVVRTIDAELSRALMDTSDAQ
jgi:very-short-patch-repair endonuclease